MGGDRNVLKLSNSEVLLMEKDIYSICYTPTHLLEARMWDQLCIVLTESGFLQAKLDIITGDTEHGVSLSAIFDVLRDFENTLRALPADHVKREQVSKMFDSIKSQQTAIIPPDLGSVTELYIPLSTPKAVILNVQDSFSNLEARKYMVNILDRFIKDYGTNLVFVEGGSGDVSLCSLREKGTQERRIEVAEKYLMDLKISPEEYLDIISDYPLILWGVEDKDLYDKHHKSFLETVDLKERLEPALSSLHQTIDLLKEKWQDSAVAMLEAKIIAYEKKDLGLADYSDFLVHTATQTGINTEEYPNLSVFVNVARLEKTIDREKVRLERSNFIKDLAKRMQDKSDIQDLNEKTEEFKTGKITEIEYYTLLENLASGLGIDIDAYSEFSDYSNYLKNGTRIKVPGLVQEIDRIIELLRVKLAPTPQYRSLVFMDEQLHYIEKALGHHFTPADYERFCSLNIKDIAHEWTDFLNKHSLGCLSENDSILLTELEGKIPNIKQEYEIAQLREDAMIKNIMAKLVDTGEKTAILIAGGYHTTRIAEGLKKCNVGLLEVRPKINQRSDDKLYISVLKERRSGKKIQSNLDDQASSD